MKVLSLKALAQEADVLTSEGQGQQLARVIQAQVEKLSYQQSPEEAVCLSFADIKIATVAFLQALLVPLIELNRHHKTINKFYISDVTNELWLEIRALIALHRETHKATVKEFAVVVLQNNQPKVLGHLGKSIRQTLAFIGEHREAFLNALSVAEHCKRSVGSMRNHLNQLVKIGFLFRQRIRNKMIYRVAFQSPDRTLFQYESVFQEYDATDSFDPLTDPCYDDFHEGMYILSQA